MRFRFVQEHRGATSVGRACQVLGLSRSGYYRQRGRPISRRQRANDLLLVRIQESYEQSRRCYGALKVHRDLLDWGLRCGHNRVARLMRMAGLRAKSRRRFRPMPSTSRPEAVAPNRLNQVFLAPRPNQVWVTDITYVWTREGWLYLAVVLDLFSRYVVGWAVSGSPDTALTRTALDMAVARRAPAPGLLHHSDQGCQYTARDYQLQLTLRHITVSMSRRGNCYDNAAVESFFHLLKIEEVHHQKYETRKEAGANIVDYIEMFYNSRRRHSTLGYLSPAEYERQNPHAFLPVH